MQLLFYSHDDQICSVSSLSLSCCLQKLCTVSADTSLQLLFHSAYGESPVLFQLSDALFPESFVWFDSVKTGTSKSLVLVFFVISSLKLINI